MAGIKLELQSKNKVIPCCSGLNHAIESFPFEFSDAPCSSTWPDGKLFAGWHETNPCGVSAAQASCPTWISGHPRRERLMFLGSRHRDWYLTAEFHLDDRVAESKSPYWTPIGH